MSSSGRDLSRADILSLLREVGEILVERGREAAIYVVGGSAMAIDYESRRVTRDVDAEIRRGHEDFWAAAAAVAERHGLDPDWVNSSAVAFMTREDDTDSSELTLPGLRVAVASPEHLIAMKLRALRDRDMDDLEVLFRHVGITRPEEAAAIHNRLFDDSYIGYFDPDEARYAAQRVFDRAAAMGRTIAPGGESQEPMGMHWVSPHMRGGRHVEGFWRRSPRR